MDRILDRIKKLLALAGNNPSKEEALAAMAKAQAMMLEHKIELADIPDDDPEKHEEPILEEVDIGGNTRTVTWRRSLHMVICEAHFCKAVCLPGTTRKQVVGKRSHIQLVTYLYNYLVREIDRLFVEYCRRGGFLRRPDQRSFAFGVIAELGQRFRDERARMTTPAAGATSSYNQQSMTAERCQALIVVEDKAVAQAFKRHFPHTRKGSSSTIRNSEAYHAGRQAGKSITIRPGVGSGAGQRQLS